VIIAVVGMTGSGKSVMCEVLKAQGIPVVRFGQFVIDEMERQGLPKGPESERIVRERLREDPSVPTLMRQFSWS
jgi:dephospho-CoA kinase